MKTRLTYPVCVSDALVAEIKRIVKESEILKYVRWSDHTSKSLIQTREDDTKWPQKNKDGRQELEIRLGSEHISFEVFRRPALQREVLMSTDCQNWLFARCTGLVRPRRSPRVLLPCSRPEGSRLLINFAALQGRAFHHVQVGHCSQCTDQAYLETQSFIGGARHVLQTTSTRDGARMHWDCSHCKYGQAHEACGEGQEQLELIRSRKGSARARVAAEKRDLVTDNFHEEPLSLWLQAHKVPAKVEQERSRQLIYILATTPPEPNSTCDRVICGLHRA